MNPDALKDIKPPVDFPPDYTLLYVILFLVFAAAAFFLLKYFLQQKKEPPTVPVKFSAFEIASKRLSLLVQKNYPAQGKIKEYFSELADIIRRYIEERFYLKAPEMTTHEFLEKISHGQELKSEHKQLFKEFLNVCDQVKFAKYSPAAKEIEEAFQLAKRFLEETRDGI